MTSDGTYSYTYDANGNMASRSGGRSFSYDNDNRVSSVSDGGSYGYDASGGRVKMWTWGLRWRCRVWSCFPQAPPPRPSPGKGLSRELSQPGRSTRSRWRLRNSAGEQPASLLTQRDRWEASQKPNESAI